LFGAEFTGLKNFRMLNWSRIYRIKEFSECLIGAEFTGLKNFRMLN
jgi:hypothetical protein